MYAQVLVGGVTVSLTCLAVDVSNSFEEHLSKSVMNACQLVFVWYFPSWLHWDYVFWKKTGNVLCSFYPIMDLCYHLDEAAFGRFLHWKDFLFPCPHYLLWKEVTTLPLLSWEWCTPFFRTEYLHKWFIIFLQGTIISSLHLFDSLCMHHMYLYFAI